MTKFALLSHILPPSPSGQSVMLYRILSGIDPDTYYLISREMDANRHHQQDNSHSLPARIFKLRDVPYLNRLNQISSGYIRDVINIFWPIVFRTKELLEILRKNPVEILIACSGDITDIPAGFLASKIVGTRFLAYIFDDYVYQWTGMDRLFARFAASIIFRNSSGMIGPNEFICDEFRRRYGIPCTLVRNPCNADEMKYPVFPRWPAEQGVIRIIYTGAIYHANYDCFRNLTRAMESLKNHKVELHIYSAQTVEQLAAQGIQGDYVYVHSHVPYDQILEQQRKADILFLPLAFESPIPEVIQTSAPGKMGEYLLSGRPVVAHVPDDSFVADYLRKNQSAVVVVKNDPSPLAEAIKELILDTELRNKITINARLLAQREMTPETARNQFCELLLSVSGRNIK